MLEPYDALLVYILSYLSLVISRTAYLTYGSILTLQVNNLLWKMFKSKFHSRYVS